MHVPPSSTTVGVASTSNNNDGQRQPPHSRMARLAKSPKSKSALVPLEEPHDSNHLDKIQTECERIISVFRDLAQEKHRVWPRFKQLESSFVNQPTSTLDPTTVRSYIPHEIISILLAASPEEEFTVTNPRYVGKVRKVSAIWNLDAKHLLFQTAFDYGNQGEGFFSALFALAKADDDWPRCRSALQATVRERRQLPVLSHTSRRDTPLSFRKGIIESDVRAVISRVAPPTPPSPAHSPHLSHDQSRNPNPEPPRTPTKATRISQNPGVELEIVAESTPERGRQARRHQSPIFTPSAKSPTQSSASSPVPLCESETLAAVETEESLSQNEQPNTADDLVVDEVGECHFVDDSAVSDDFLVDGAFLVGALGADNETSVGNDSQTHATKEAPHVNAAGTVPVTSATSDQQSTVPQAHAAEEQRKMSPAPKRPRLNAAGVDSASDAQEIIKEDTWITDRQLMHAIIPMCDTSQSGANGVMVVDSLETQKMVQDSYVLCRSILCRISRVALILLPLNLGNDHWALATVNKRNYAATSLKLFDSLPSDRRLIEARKIIVTFVKSYLWDTPSNARVVIPCASPHQTNNSDCGVFTFAFALFKTTNRDLPASLDSRLWRRIMAGCLHKGSSSDLSIFVPEPTSTVSIPKPAPSTALSRVQRMKALSNEYRQVREDLDNDLKRHSTVLCHVSLAAQVMDDIADSMSSYITELEGKLTVAKVLEQATGDHCRATHLNDDVNADQPSAIRLATLVERARETSECADHTLAEIAKVRDEIQRAYDKLGEDLDVMGGKGRIGLE